MAKAMSSPEFEVNEILGFLDEYVAPNKQEAFMVSLGTTLGNMEDNSVNRREVFNLIYKKLGNKRRQKEVEAA